jgi:predicted nucleic acid-binding protein
VIAVDTSVVIAALSPWHERHGDAAQACHGDAAIPAHALLEAYSTLTRMPEPLRISGAVAAEALSRAWGGRTLAVPEDLSADLPVRLSRASIVGGASYDGLVALTAQAHARLIVSLDRRAERTYRLLGVDYRMLA